MSDTKAQPEPTMEEILASIRRIISDNDEQGATTTSAPTPANQSSPDSVLELTEMVAEDGSVVSLNASFDETPVIPADDEGNTAALDDDGDNNESAIATDDDEIPPLPDDGVAGDIAEEPEVAMEDTQDDKVEFSADEPIGQAKPQDGLMSAAAAGATAAAFAALARSSQQSGNGGLALGSGRTLEDLVQEMIRPMIKEWLDKNLPPMAERLVRKELERLSRRAED